MILFLADFNIDTSVLIAARNTDLYENRKVLMQNMLNHLPIENFEEFDKFQNPEFCVAVSSYLNFVCPRLDTKSKAIDLLNRLIDSRLQACLIWPSRVSYTNDTKRTIPQYVAEFISNYWMTNSDIPIKTAIFIFRNKLRNQSYKYSKMLKS